MSASVNAYRLRYIASFGAYAPPNSKLCLRAVGEIAAKMRDFRLRRIYPRSATDKRACRSSSVICELAFCALRRGELSSSPQAKKNRQPWGLSVLFWSKWRDSNSRPPVPEQIRHRFLTTFVDFLMLFSPKTVLSDAPRRTVST